MPTSGSLMLPLDPIYVVSKGRWQANRRWTSRALQDLGVPHYVVVEEQEADAYREAVGSLATVLVLDPLYQRDYDTCDDLGATKSKGPGPARNYAWEHSLAAGHAWHWVMDDNIGKTYGRGDAARVCGWLRLQRNLKTPGADPSILRAMEDFVSRYANVAMAGPNYFMFASRKAKVPPFTLNTRIYSCNLIRNDLPYRWRGRYNEDTDLSLRMLKDGWVTVLFNAFLQYKRPTQEIAGGNTAEFYAKEGTLPKSRMLVELHPDVSRLTWKFGRWHHEVDYRPFRKNRLRLKPGVVIPSEPNEYGMVYQERREDEWVTVRG